MLPTFIYPQWESTEGPSLFYITSLNRYNNQVIAGTSSGGVFISSSGYTNWKQLGGSILPSPVKTFAVINNKLFAGTVKGLFVLVNNSEWKEIKSAIAGITVLSLLQKGKSIFAGTTEGVFVSKNGGITWSLINLLPRCSINNLLLKGNRIIAASYEKGMFFSDNNGRDWKSSNNGLSNYNITSIAIIRKNIFAATATDIFISNDNGLNWSKTTGGIGSPVRVLYTQNNILYACTAGKGIFVSYNEGKSWKNLKLPEQSQMILSFISNKGNLFAGTNGTGVFYSNDNGTDWIACNNGLKDRHPLISSLFFSGKHLFAFTVGAGVNIYDAINGWMPVSTGSNEMDFSSGADSGNLLIAGSNSGEILYSRNSALIWDKLKIGPIQAPVKSLLLHNSSLYIGTDGLGLYMYDFNSGNLKDLNSGLTNSSIRAITNDGEYIYCGTWGNGIFRIKPDGPKWEPVNSGLNNLNIYTVSVIDSSLFAGTVKGVYISKDFGNTWTGPVIDLNNSAVYSIIKGNGIIFAGTSNGLFFSYDNGTTWNNAGALLGEKFILTLTIDNDYLYAGTFNSGVWRISIPFLMKNRSN